MLIKRLLCLNALFLLGASSSSLAAGSDRPLIDGTVYTQAQRLVEIEPGRSLNLYCAGTGSPTVVFDAGLGDPINVWGYVQAAIAGKTRTCAYDRAGIGFSDPGQRPASSANIVDDLHRLLVAAKIAPPYVLVAHSYGGLNARLYAYTYPAEVAGMVLVDTVVENQTEAFRQIDPEKRTPAQWDAYAIEPGLRTRRECIAAATAGFVPGTELFKKCEFDQLPQLSPAVQTATIKFQMRPAFQKTQLTEEENVFRASAEQVRGTRRSYGKLPLIVLTKSYKPSTNPLTPEQFANREARYKTWFRLHEEVASLSTRGIHEIVPDSGHYIQLEKPEAVSDGIVRVLHMIAD